MEKVTNPFFLEEAGEYLEANGYERTEHSFFSNVIFFRRGDRGIAVMGDNVDFLVFDEGEPEQRNAHFARCHSFTGISDLDLQKWIFLFHIADIVPLKEFVKQVRKEPDGEKQVEDLFAHFGQLFRPGAVSVPEAY